MIVTIINGLSNGLDKFEKAINKISDDLSDEHEINVFDIKNTDISFCVGCFKCWTTTPGKCVLKDDMDTILKSIIKSDLLLYVSPITAGFLSSDTKKVMDRMLPTVVPFIRVFNGECHHPGRYENEPDLGLFLVDDGNVDEESKNLSFELIDRLSLNFHAGKTIKKVVNETNFVEVFENEISNY